MHFKMRHIILKNIKTQKASFPSQEGTHNGETLQPTHKFITVTYYDLKARVYTFI